MYICEECHNKRQNRKALESQPLQFIYGINETFTHSCPECGTRKKQKAFQYLNAYELVMELEELKEKHEKLVVPDSFPVQGYHSAQDLFDRSKVFPAILNDAEAMQNALQYAAEIESILEEVQP
jgi:uncharacterized protein YlaI